MKIERIYMNATVKVGFYDQFFIFRSNSCPPLPRTTFDSRWTFEADR